MVLVGFEPDLYVAEVNGPDHPKNRGTTQEYKDCYRRFVQIFEDEGVTNAIWAVDYAWNIRDWPDLAIDLWPGPMVDWLFFHVYQFRKISSPDGKGDCVGGFEKIYKDFEDRIA